MITLFYRSITGGWTSSQHRCGEGSVVSSSGGLWLTHECLLNGQPQTGTRGSHLVGPDL